jgi:hypothetical protein
LIQRRVSREGKKKEGNEEIKRKMEKGGGGGRGNGHFIPPSIQRVGSGDSNTPQIGLLAVL